MSEQRPQQMLRPTSRRVVTWERVMTMLRHGTAVLVCGLGLAGSAADADETIAFRSEPDQPMREVSGRVLAASAEGGVLLEGRDSVIWPIPGQQIIDRSTDDTEFAYFNSRELGERMLAELPPGFEVHTTSHYVICYNTSLAYAKWCGGLYERLYRAFTNYWRNKREFELSQGPPLVAIVFDDKHGYEQYGEDEVGDGIRSIIGHYSFRTNRIASYDLTGLGRRGRNSGRDQVAAINRSMSNPRSERTVATLIHEATHQLAYNCGLLQRFAEVPTWYNEGLAIYFETPDLGTGRAWRTIGGINWYRLKQFRRHLRHRPEGTLATLLVDDGRFRNTRTADAAYAESWALCYFLMSTKRSEFLEYSRRMSQLAPLEPHTAEHRLQAFQDVFGDDLDALEHEFLHYVSRIR